MLQSVVVGACRKSSNDVSGRWLANDRCVARKLAQSSLGVWALSLVNFRLGVLAFPRWAHLTQNCLFRFQFVCSLFKNRFVRRTFTKDWITSFIPSFILCSWRRLCCHLHNCEEEIRPQLVFELCLYIIGRWYPVITKIMLAFTLRIVVEVRLQILLKSLRWYLGTA